MKEIEKNKNKKIKKNKKKKIKKKLKKIKIFDGVNV